MKIREAYELINRLKTIKAMLQRKYDDVHITNDMTLLRKIRKYNEEIDKIEETILEQNFDDKFVFNTDLYIIKESDKL